MGVFVYFSYIFCTFLLKLLLSNKNSCNFVVAKETICLYYYKILSAMFRETVILTNNEEKEKKDKSSTALCFTLMFTSLFIMATTFFLLCTIF